MENPFSLVLGESVPNSPTCTEMQVVPATVTLQKAGISVSHPVLQYTSL